tara:strand:+ start:3157 stop:3330 length:174 start_codon:yes stop_codon:yes gene_type:complete
MFFSGRTWLIILLLSIVLGIGIKRHMKLQSTLEFFESNLSLPLGIDVESIIKNAQSK